MYHIRVELWRGPEYRREARRLPATLYATCKRLGLHREGTSVFVPIRAMQYQAVLDRDEVVFVDGQRPSVVQIACQGFRPQDRTGLAEAVPFDWVLYEPVESALIGRLWSEWPRALQAYEAKLPPMEPQGRRLLTVPVARWRRREED